MEQAFRDKEEVNKAAQLEMALNGGHCVRAVGRSVLARQVNHARRRQESQRRMEADRHDPLLRPLTSMRGPPDTSVKTCINAAKAIAALTVAMPSDKAVRNVLTDITAVPCALVRSAVSLL